MGGIFFGNEPPAEGIDVIPPPTAKTRLGFGVIFVGRGLLRHMGTLRVLVFNLRWNRLVLEPHRVIKRDSKSGTPPL